MGGSSLCAEVFRDVPGRTRDSCRLAVLDTTDERTIRAATESLDPARSLFIVASKSGSTIEVAALERHFFAVMSEQLDGKAGPHFVAITDPGTALETLAIDRRYRDTFINPPDIGGRYSALSLFGLVPAALLGLDIAALGRSAERMAVECQSDAETNPGLVLGSFMAQHAVEGRDKLTLLLSGDSRRLARGSNNSWPRAPARTAEACCRSSASRPARSKNTEPTARSCRFRRRQTALPVRSCANWNVPGHPVLCIATSPMELGAEFFRWEFATAVAGAALAMNPFDEPNVREAKLRTQAQLDAKTANGLFRLDPPFERGEGYSRREFRPAWQPASPRRRYLAMLDYLPADERRASTRQPPARHDSQASGLATTHGVGPRYLHSTGQFHKGGPNSGVFVLLTAADATATPVPGKPLHVQHAQAGAGARRLRSARRKRPRGRALPPGRSGRGLHHRPRAPARSTR